MVKPLNFDSIKRFVSQCDWALVLAKPLGSKLFRVYNTPKLDLSEQDQKELVETLNTLCIRHHKGVWYFKLDEEDLQITADTFSEMNYVVYIMTPSHQELN